MKIVAIRSYIKKMALTKPYTIAYNTFSDVRLVFLEIELANGMIGYGSASPAEDVVGETTEQSFANLSSEFIQEFVGRDIRQFRQLIYEIKQKFPHLPGTLAAFDIATHDAFGKLLGIAIVDLYGRKIKSLPTSVTIGIKNVQETLEDAADYFKLGFKVLKVKTGLSVEEDIERIARLSESYQRRMTIRVDANQGYTQTDLQRFLQATNKFGIELIEQPLPVGKENELLQLPYETRQFLAADESLKDPEAALKLAVGERSFGIYNIKLMKCGGILEALDIANIAYHGKIDLFWGCNDESRISITAALHAAYSCVHTKYIDLDGSFDLAEDLLNGGFELKDGHLEISNQPGLGLTQ